MSDPSAEINRLREGIKEMLKRVPASVNAGGIRVSQAYKKAAIDARKAVESSRPTLAKMQQAYTQLNQYGR